MKYIFLKVKAILPILPILDIWLKSKTEHMSPTKMMIMLKNCKRHNFHV